MAGGILLATIPYMYWLGSDSLVCGLFCSCHWCETWVDIIELGKVLVALGTVDGVSCSNVGCLSCLGKQLMGGLCVLVLVFLGVFVLAVSTKVSMRGSVKLGRVPWALITAGEISCCSTSCLSCQGT